LFLADFYIQPIGQDTKSASLLFLSILLHGFISRFHPSMLFDIVPHLYCTIDIALFVFTLFAEEFVSDDIANVLKSCLKIAKCSWDPNLCPLEIAARSSDPPFRWRLNKDAGAVAPPQAARIGNQPAAQVMNGYAAGGDAPDSDKFMLE